MVAIAERSYLCAKGNDLGLVLQRVFSYLKALVLCFVLCFVRLPNAVMKRQQLVLQREISC